MKNDHFYQTKLGAYFDTDYSAYEDEVEFYTDPYPNQWRFKIPSINKVVELTCDDNGYVSEKRSFLDVYKADICDLWRTVRFGGGSLYAVYEDYIRSLVGNDGFGRLCEEKLLEFCGSKNGRNLYILLNLPDSK